MKRVLDASVAGLGLLALAPVMGAIAIAIALETGRPVLFRQIRVGRDLEPFVLFKFRSMIVDHNGAEITADGDDRTTRVGRILRATKLDELPQLINVVRGDMSLVGPRPEVPKFVAMYEDSFREVMTVRPGITGAASLIFADEASYLAGAADAEQMYATTILPQKLAIETAYVRERTLLSDIGIIGKTIITILGIGRKTQPTRDQ